MQSATLPTLRRGRARIIVLAALLLCTISVALAVITVSAQSGGNGPVTHTGVGEPETVGPVSNLTATAADGEVRLAWTPAQNAQVHFVVYLPAADARAGNYADTQMVAVSGGSNTVIAGLSNGTAYIFNAIGMRWNWVNYGAVWGSWDRWANATPAAAPTATPAPATRPIRLRQRLPLRPRAAAWSSTRLRQHRRLHLPPRPRLPPHQCRRLPPRRPRLRLPPHRRLRLPPRPRRRPLRPGIPAVSPVTGQPWLRSTKPPTAPIGEATTTG